MRLFIGAVVKLLKEQGQSQTALVERCNKNGAKDGLQISKGAVSNYKQGRFPEYSYASLIIRSITDDQAVRNDLCIAYLQDGANELGVATSELKLVNLRTRKVDTLSSLPAYLREQLDALGRASLKAPEMRTAVAQLSAMAQRRLSAPRQGVPKRGMKRNRTK